MPPKSNSDRNSKNNNASTSHNEGKADKSKDKRAKVQATRAIPAQPAGAALKNGELDLQAFLAAHEFEIRSLEQSIATSKASSTSRAFQQVPRGLRRRTASHNPKRVPKRLRNRAKKEMKDDNTPTVESRKRKPRTTRARIRAETARRLGILSARKRRKRLKRAEAAGADLESKKQRRNLLLRKARPKIRRNVPNQPPEPPAKHRKRQLNKTWLPTHIWHSKRARMTDPKEPLWRFAMPLTPNEKIYRPVHRAHGDRGAIVWDRSYMSTIGLYGNAAGMERVLKRVGVAEEACWSAKGTRWRMGSRSWSGWLSRGTPDGSRQMCQAVVFWNPISPKDEENTETDPKKLNREVLLRIHPAAFLEVFQEILRLAKMETPQLYIEDLRYEIGSIELTGPASTETLQAILTPFATPERPMSQHAQLFQALKRLTNPSALPPNTMLGFSVQDPRLRYPPRKSEFKEDEDEEMKLLEVIAQWPAEVDMQPYGIFDRDSRHTAAKLPSQQLLNRRKGLKAPGTVLKPTLGDPPIPIVLLVTRSGSATQAQGTWTLLAPWSCILPLWYSVVHCPLSSGGNPRFAGLNQTRQVAFERSLPWFPADFPTTDAGIAWEQDQRRLRKRAWDGRPKSKRVEWDSLDLGAGRKGEVGDGLACDYELLFELQKDIQGQPTTSQSDPSAMDIDEPASTSKSSARRKEPLARLNLVNRRKLHELVSSVPDSLPSIPPNSLLTVRIRILSRGTVGPCARIYRLPKVAQPKPTSSIAEVPASIPPEGHPSSSSSTSRLPHDLRSQWLASVPTPKGPSKPGLVNKTRPGGVLNLETRKQLLAKELTATPAPHPPPKINSQDIDGHPLAPDAEDLIGFVTTGEFCLSEGCGMAIGSISAEKVLADVRADNKEGRLCVVRNAGMSIGWIARWDAI